MLSHFLSKTLATTGISAVLVMTTIAPSMAMMQPQEEEKKSAPAAPISTVQAPEGVVPTPISLTDLPPSTTTAVTISSLVKTTEGGTEVISGAVQAHPPTEFGTPSTSSTLTSQTVLPTALTMTVEPPVEVLMAQQKAAATSASCTSSLSFEEDTKRVKALDELESSLNTKDNPLGTRIRNVTKNVKDMERWGRRVPFLLTNSNMKVLKHKPLLLGKALREQLKDIRMDAHFFVIASGADFFFEGLNTDERHQRLTHLDQCSTIQLFLFLNCFDDPENRKHWKKLSLDKQDATLKHLKDLSEAHVSLIFQNYRTFFTWNHDGFLGTNDAKLIGHMKEIPLDVLQLIIENKSILFNGILNINSADTMLWRLKDFKTKDALEAFLKDLKDNEYNWFRYGTTPEKRQEIIQNKMFSARKL